MHVALAAAPALGDDRRLAWRLEVGDDLVVIEITHDGSRWHAYHRIVATLSVLMFAAAILAATRFDVGLELEVEEGGQARIDHEDDIAAITTVATGRPAVWAILLAQKSHTAASTVSGANVNLGFIDELHGRTSAPQP